MKVILDIDNIRYIVYTSKTIKSCNAYNEYLELAHSLDYHVSRTSINHSFEYANIIVHAYKEGKLQGSLWGTEKENNIYGKYLYVERLLFRNLRNLNVFLTLGCIFYHAVMNMYQKDLYVAYITRNESVKNLMELISETIGISHLNNIPEIDIVVHDIFKGYQKPVFKNGVLKDIYHSDVIRSGDYTGIDYNSKDGSIVIGILYRNFETLCTLERAVSRKIFEKTFVIQKNIGGLIRELG